MKSNLAYAYDLDDPQTRREIFDDFLREPPKDDDELHWWIKTFCGYDIPRRPSGICAADHVAPFSFIADQFFERSTSSFGFANRNGGKTFMTALLNLLDMVFKPGVYIVLAGAVREQAAEGYRYLLELIGNEPLLAEMLAALPTMERTVLVNDSRIKITCATYCVKWSTMVRTIEGWKRICDIQRGDVVWGWNGSEPSRGVVAWAGKTGTAPTLDLRLSNGRVLTLTHPHLCLTADGRWIAAQDLRVGDALQGVSGLWKTAGSDGEIVAKETRYGTLPGMLAPAWHEEARAQLSGMQQAVSARASSSIRLLRPVLASHRPEEAGAGYSLSSVREGVPAQAAATERSLPRLLVHRESAARHVLQVHELWRASARAPEEQDWSLPRLLEAEGHRDLARQRDGALVTAREAHGRAPHAPRHQVRGRHQDREVDGRLLASGAPCCGRGAGNLLAFGREVGRPRPPQARVPAPVRLPSDRGLGKPGVQVVHVVGITPGTITDVHDLTVPGLRSFDAEGVIVSNSGLNGPHPTKLRWDEVELIHPSYIKEGLSMTVSHPRGYKAQDTFTSTRKVSAGTVQQLLDEKDERGLNIYNFCVWENLEKCSRKCRDPETGKMCPAYAKPDKDGNLKAICGILDGAAEPHGKAQLLPLGGFYKLDDFIRKCAIQDRLTLETQWFNYKPSGGALIYGDYFKDEPPFILTDSEARAILIRMETERNWMRTVGIDFGSNFAVAFWACDPMDQVWYKYHEIFWSPDQDLPLEFRARKIKEGDPLGWSARTMVWCDPAGKQQIIDLQNYRIDALPANNDVLAGIQFIKGRLEWRSQRGLPGLRYFPPSVNLGVDAEGKARIVGCRNSIVEMAEKYVHPQTKSGDVDRDKILKKNDHNCDADRYALFTSSVQGISNYRSRRLQGVW